MSYRGGAAAIFAAATSPGVHIPHDARRHIARRLREVSQHVRAGTFECSTRRSQHRGATNPHLTCPHRRMFVNRFLPYRSGSCRSGLTVANDRAPTDRRLECVVQAFLRRRCRGVGLRRRHRFPEGSSSGHPATLGLVPAVSGGLVLVHVHHVLEVALSTARREITSAQLHQDGSPADALAVGGHGFGRSLLVYGKLVRRQIESDGKGFGDVGPSSLFGSTSLPGEPG